MSQIILGDWVNGGRAVLDLPRLLESRMLVQASSGGGKSWLLRRMLEITSGQVQQIIVDPEGEFASLREAHDLVIVAQSGGDALAHPKTAALLAVRLLETGVSAVIDIYDLKKRDRELFVQLLIDALVNAPKALWHPVMVVVDEAHMFCDENEKALSTQSIIDLATRGRKRGLCLVAATQRISDFNKSAAAQLKNKLIGNTGLDVDVKRAAFELGKQPKEAMGMLRALNSGEFFAFGPALSVDIQMLKVGDVKTTHPKVGNRQMLTPPKPTAAIKAILPKLADLPKEAEEEARTVEALQRELAAAKRSLAAQAPTVDPAAVDRAYKDGFDAGATQAVAKGFDQGYAAASAAIAGIVQGVIKAGDDFMVQLRAAATAIAEVPKPAAPAYTGAPVVTFDRPLPKGTKMTIEYKQPPRSERSNLDPPTATRTGRSLNGKPYDLSKAAMKVLAVLAQFREGCEVGRLTLLTGYRYSGGFRNTLSELRTGGFLEGDNGGTLRITPHGDQLGPFPQLPSGAALLDYWLNHPSFGKAAKAILGELAAGEPRTAEQLSRATGYEYSGGFRNALSELRTAGVLVGSNTGQMRISPEIVP
jgi:hypothetical protein